MSIQTVSKGITRLDIESNCGYVVRMSRGGNRISKYFSDSQNGGKRKALIAAKACYDELLKTMGPANASPTGRLTSRNSTGVVGVHVAYTQDNRYPGCEYYAYCASWVTESGKREKASFAWNKYGQDLAMELAILARDRRISDREKVVALYEQTGASKKSGKGKTVKKTVKKQAKKTVKKKAVKRAAKKSVKKVVKKAAKKSVKKKAKQR